MKKGIAVAVSVVAMIMGGLLATAVAAPPGPDPVSEILEKLDQLLTAVDTFDLRGVTQNWDKALPANDPGGPCPSSSSRFTCVLGGAAVRDNQTGLVWEQAPATSTHTWIRIIGAGQTAPRVCLGRTTGGQKGWRLPSVHELASLLDPTQQDPALPLGHPFTVSSAGGRGFWSVTHSRDDFIDPGVLVPLVYMVHFDPFGGFINDTTSALHFKVWCVRGGASLTQY